MLVYIAIELFTDEWCINGVFSTREKAETFIKNYKSKLYGVQDIEEYEVDETIVEFANPLKPLENRA